MGEYQIILNFYMGLELFINIWLLPASCIHSILKMFLFSYIVFSYIYNLQSLKLFACVSFTASFFTLMRFIF